jgi:hypothetical protein
MKKIVLPILAMILCSTKLIAQEATVSAGGIDVVPEGSISYSIGITFYTAEETEEGTLNQGVQHVQQEIITQVGQLVLPLAEVKVFPNPVVSEAQLNVNISDFSNVNFTITDMAVSYTHLTLPTN